MKYIVLALALLFSTAASAQYQAPIPSLSGPQDISTTNATINSIVNNINQFYTNLPYTNFANFAIANGCYAGGNVDCTVAINAYYTWVCQQTTELVNNRVVRPQAFMPAGKYLFTGTINPVLCTGAGLVAVPNSFVALLRTTSPLFSAGPFTTSPVDNTGNPSYYTDTGSGYTIDHVQCVDDRGQNQGTRVAVCVQDNGAGGGVVYIDKCYGVKFCFAGAYGSDITDVSIQRVEFSDYGLYEGPGSQQFVVNKFNCSATLYCMTVEGAGTLFMKAPNFEYCGVLGSTSNHGGYCFGWIHNLSTTLFGLPVNLDNPGSTSPGGNFKQDVQLVIDSPWFETRSTCCQPISPVVCGGTQTSDVKRGLTIRNAYIVAGGTQVTGAAFIGNPTGGQPCFNIFLDGATLTNSYFEAWFNSDNAAANRITFNDIKVVNGATAIPLLTAADAGTGVTDRTLYTVGNGVCPTSGYYTRGTVARNVSVANVGGKLQFGCVRITAGTKSPQANVLGTDWSLLYGTDN